MPREKNQAEPPFEIRPAKPGDIPHLKKMIEELAEYEKMSGECRVTKKGLERHLFGENPAAEALLALYEGNPAGFALYIQNFSTFLAKPGLYLEDLFVRPEYRKRGIGRALLVKLAAIARERGYGRMEWAVLEWNELAKKQYRKIGAEPLKEWRTWRITGKDLEKLSEEIVLVSTGDQEVETIEPGAEKPEKREAKEKKQVVIYTDGGAQPNPGTGAWAAVLEYKGTTRELVGGEKETTNNRMELMAAIRALESLKQPCIVEMHTDSQYVRNGITKWITNWKRRGWMRGKDPVKNVDLWKRLDQAIQRHDIVWSWVRGHSGVVMNERCDELCNQEIARIKSEN